MLGFNGEDGYRERGSPLTPNPDPVPRSPHSTHALPVLPKPPLRSVLRCTIPS